MIDVLDRLAALRRPGLLIRAARCGVEDYRRERHLARLLGPMALPGPIAALVRLLDLEAELEAMRRNDDAGYLAARHVAVVIALLGEARLLRISRQSAEDGGTIDEGAPVGAPSLVFRSAQLRARPLPGLRGAGLAPAPAAYMKASGISALRRAT